jgi:hypothetical protein
MPSEVTDICRCSPGTLMAGKASVTIVRADAEGAERATAAERGNTALARATLRAAVPAKERTAEAILRGA